MGSRGLSILVSHIQPLPTVTPLSSPTKEELWVRDKIQLGHQPPTNKISTASPVLYSRDQKACPTPNSL